MRVIELDTAETFYSLRHRLLNGGRGRVVLRLPEHGAALGVVDLALLRRLADHERLEIGLVTADRDLARRARGLGLPAFSSLALAEHYRPGWWRGRRRAERLGLTLAERAMTAERPLTSGHRPLIIALVLLWLALLAGVAAALWFLPRATITLRPATRAAQVIVPVTADAELTAPNLDAAIVPARPVTETLAWEAGGPGTDAVARQSVRALALQALGAAAEERLAARLNAGERLVPGSARLVVAEEQFATAAGRTRLTLQAELSGLAVAEADLVRLVAPPLAAALPPNFAADPATPRLDLEPGVGDGVFIVTARATGRAMLDTASLSRQLVGQHMAEAAAALNALPLAEPPRFDVRPSWWLSWFGRFPLRPERIDIQVRP